MKVRIEIIENKKDEDEVIIRCSKLDEIVQKVFDAVNDITEGSKHLKLYKGNVGNIISAGNNINLI
ncbi:MAG: hypothetical protein GX271_02320 [Clostridiales bacterium]|nr:hypothetical protein [Clostridiales bacterium]